MPNFQKVHKLLGIESMTPKEFESLMKMSPSKRGPLLKDLAKKEKQIKNVKDLEKATAPGGV
ncbi:MAG: hypothetical protein AAGK04_07770, partial [Planctomycetota bacterium]